MRTDRRDLRRRLFALAAEQGGYFTAAQARTVGYSYQAQAHHVGAGNWQRVDRGLFRLTEWVPDLHDHLARWTLWSRGRGVVSHETALSVHELGEFESPAVHLTVPPGFTLRDSAIRLHFADLPDTDVTVRTGFRVTTPLRSLIDIAASGGRRGSTRSRHRRGGGTRTDDDPPASSPGRAGRRPGRPMDRAGIGGGSCWSASSPG